MDNRAEVLRRWPLPPKNVRERLLHTVDALRELPNDARVVTATLGRYTPEGGPEWTGLTVGDLRTFSDILIGGYYDLEDVMETEAEEGAER